MKESKPSGAQATASIRTDSGGGILRILVTGGAGFIGSHLVDKLLSLGHEVTVIDNLSAGTGEFLPPQAEFIQADIRDRKTLQDLFEKRKFDVVYHEAAQTMVPVSIKDPSYDADENIMGLLSVLECARATGVRKIIFSSSAAVYGDNPALPLKEKEVPVPESFYGLTKWMTEKYLELYKKLYGLDYTILRYSNVYGPRQGANGEGGVIYIFAKALACGKPITIFGDGSQTRDFISVHDIVAANVAALEKGSGEICNVSTETEISLNELAHEIVTLAGYDDSFIHYTEERTGDIHRSCLSNEKLKSLFGWKPSYNLNDGLKDTLSFFTQRGKNTK
mgnify:FL=1